MLNFASFIRKSVFSILFLKMRLSLTLAFIFALTGLSARNDSTITHFSFVYFTPAVSIYQDPMISLQPKAGFGIGGTTGWNFNHSWNIELNAELAEARFRTADNYIYPTGNVFPDNFGHYYYPGPTYDEYIVPTLNISQLIAKQFWFKNTVFFAGAGLEFRACFGPGYNRSSQDTGASSLISGKNYFNIPSDAGLRFSAGAELSFKNSNRIRIAFVHHLPLMNFDMRKYYADRKVTSYGLQVSIPFSPERQQQRKESGKTTRENQKENGAKSPDFKNQLYVEIGGPVYLSLNYERNILRSAGEKSRLNLRAGYFNTFSKSNNYHVAMAGLSWLVGRNRVAAELGAGAAARFDYGLETSAYLTGGMRFTGWNGFTARLNIGVTAGQPYTRFMPGFSLGYAF